MFTLQAKHHSSVPLSISSNLSLNVSSTYLIIFDKMFRFLIKSRSVLLIILWDVFMCAHLNLITCFAATNYAELNNDAHHIIFDIGYCLIFFLFPFFGLLADIKVGRYTSIITGVYLSFLSWIIAGLGSIIKIFLHYNVVYYIISGFTYLLQVIGNSCVRSNIVQFNIDQAIGASGDELSAMIYWHSLSLPVIFFIDIIVQCLINQFIDYIIVSYVLSGVAVSTVIVTNFLFKHWLDTTSHIVNPVKLIVKVLNYARKNKYPRNRSALTYWEENYPSRLDLGKDKYGGPFTEEEVENVKVVIRLSPLLICIVGLVCADNINWVSYYKSDENLSFFDCFMFKNALQALVASLLILFYQLIIHPCFHNYIPNMLKRIGIGLVFSLLTTIYSVILLACNDYFHFDTTSYKFTIVSQVLYGIAYALIFPTSLLFTIAQAPHEMRGLMVGLWYAARGVGYVIIINSKYVFACEEETTCKSLYYFIFKSVVIIIILIVFLVLAKRYKLRVRENEINVHLIAEEHYERYMDQEVEYNNELGLSFETTD